MVGDENGCEECKKGKMEKEGKGKSEGKRLIV
jgi:hypothetical protein